MIRRRTEGAALKQTVTFCVRHQRMLRISAAPAMHPQLGSAASRITRWARLVPYALSAALAAPVMSEATTLHMPDITYNYTVVEQKIPDVIEEFGRNVDIKVHVSPEVGGTVGHFRFNGNARGFFDRLMRDNNLEWYYDSGVLYVTAAKENRTQLLAISPIDFNRLKSALESLGISDSRFPIRPAPGRGVVMTYGPPRYVALIEQTLAGLVAEELSRRAPNQDATLMVFRGSQTTVFRQGVVAGSDAESAKRPSEKSSSP